MKKKIEKNYDRYDTDYSTDPEESKTKKEITASSLTTDEAPVMLNQKNTEAKNEFFGMKSMESNNKFKQQNMSFSMPSLPSLPVLWKNSSNNNPHNNDQEHDCEFSFVPNTNSSHSKILSLPPLPPSPILTLKSKLTPSSKLVGHIDKINDDNENDLITNASAEMQPEKQQQYDKNAGQKEEKQEKHNPNSFCDSSSMRSNQKRPIFKPVFNPRNEVKQNEKRRENQSVASAAHNESKFDNVTDFRYYCVRRLQRLFQYDCVKCNPHLKENIEALIEEHTNLNSTILQQQPNIDQLNENVSQIRKAVIVLDKYLYIGKKSEHIILANNACMWKYHISYLILFLILILFWSKIMKMVD